MATVTVKQDYEKGDTFHFIVSIADGEKITTHRITVDRAYHDALVDSKRSIDKFVEESVHFLLNRESQDSILRSFNVREIGHYFPEYEAEMKKLAA